MNTPAPDKKAARSAAKAARAAVHAERGAWAGAALADQFFRAGEEGPDPIPGVHEGRVAAGYWPIRDEIDPRPLMTVLHDRGMVLSLPVIDEATRTLSFQAWAPEVDMVPHAFGTAVPASDGTRTVVPDLVLVPLLAFDRRGMRLGYGMGHYDRTLEALRRVRSIVTVGLAYGGQEMALVPSEPHDVALEWVVTEMERIECQPGP